MSSKMKLIFWLIFITLIIIIPIICYKFIWPRLSPIIFDILFSREEKIIISEATTNIIGGILTIFYYIGAFIFFLKKQVFPTNPLINRQILDLSLPLTSVDKIINPSNDKKLTTWIDRKLVTTNDLFEKPIIIIVGQMKTGKTREAGELIKRAITQGIIDEDKIFDITNDVNIEKTGITSLLEKKLDLGSRVLLYVNEIPANMTKKYYDALDEYCKGLKKCKAGYLITTLRPETIENNPDLKQWITNLNIKRINIRKLEDDEKNRIIDDLIIKYPKGWKEEFRKELIKDKDSTPYQIIITFKMINEMKIEDINLDKIKEIISQSIKTKWGIIRHGIQSTEPAAESLIEALSIFYYTRVTPITELVFGLAESIEKGKRTWLKRRNIKFHITKAANAFQPYDITYNKQFFFPDVAVEYQVNQDQAQKRLEIYLRHMYQNTSIINWKRMFPILIFGFSELAVSYYYIGDKINALNTFRWITKIIPQLWPAWSSQGFILLEEGKIEEAEKALNQAIAINPQHALNQSLLGQLLEEQGKTVEAEQAYNNACIALPEYSDAWLKLGRIREKLGMIQEAEQAYNKAITADSESAEAWMNLGMFLVYQGRNEEAEQAINKSILLNPQSGEVWIITGLIYTKQEKNEDAEKAYNKAIIASPQNALAWAALASLMEEQGRIKEAELAYNKSIIFDPKNKLYINRLIMLLRKQKHYRKAKNILEQAILNDPGNAYYHASLATVLRKLKKNTDADQEISKAKQLPGEENIYNRACIAALCNEQAIAFSLLRQTLQKHEQEVKWVLQDPDWEELLDNTEFKMIIKETFETKSNVIQNIKKKQSHKYKAEDIKLESHQDDFKGNK